MFLWKYLLAFGHSDAFDISIQSEIPASCSVSTYSRAMSLGNDVFTFQHNHSLPFPQQTRDFSKK